MKRLAVFFPGIGYTVDKPLMHYSRRLAEKHGFEICLLPYSGFPKNGNHSLETADPVQDILTLQKIMSLTEQYMAK